MTLTINLLTAALAEVVEVDGPTDAALALLVRGYSPDGTAANGIVRSTVTRAPIGTYSVR